MIDRFALELSATKKKKKKEEGDPKPESNSHTICWEATLF